MSKFATRLIFLVEDDPLISKAWILGLSQSGYNVTHAPAFVDAVAILKERHFDAAIIDINLPDGSGLDVLREIRKKNRSIKTLLVTAKQDEETAIVSLDLGATEFIRKPIGPRELQTRLDRIFQYGDEPAINIVQQHDFLINENSKEILFRGHSLHFSSSEFKIMHLLIRNFGHPISRNQTLEIFDNKSDVSDRSIDSHISRIRKKLKEVASDEYSLDSVWGSGYCISKKSKK